MSTGAPIPHAVALAIAQELVDELRHACIVEDFGRGTNPLFGVERCLIAGSLRRQRPEVHDVELVLAPRLPTTLLGEVDEKAPTDVDAVLERLIRAGRLGRRKPERWGQRYKAAVAIAAAGTPGVEEDAPIPVDLFLVRPPASFAALLAIRTGPRDFSKHLVTKCQEKGRRLVDGRLVDRVGQPIATPTERAFFEACGVPWVEPEDRR